jgi:CheY-like chemotaxis protein
MARVLIVDDDADFSEVTAQLLRVVGHQTRVASDGVEALRILSAEWRPHVVLLDMFMPNMDGFETIVAIRKASADVKIIAMSGEWGRPDDRGEAVEVTDQARALGADAALCKPFDRQQLRETIEAMTQPGSAPE